MWHWLMRRIGARAGIAAVATTTRCCDLTALAGAIGVALAVIAASAADLRAQTTQRPAIEVASAVSVEVGETRLAISITRTETMPRGSFIRIRGLPADSTMTEGFAIAPSLWAVPLNSLANLRIKLSSPPKADIPLTIALATVDGDVLAEARSLLRPLGAGSAPPAPLTSGGAITTRSAAAIVAPPPIPARPPAAIPDPSEPPPPPPDPHSAAEELPLSPDQIRALGFITRAREQLAEGNIAVARLLFERAAKVGLAYGALGMAETFDPVELARQKVLGIAGDPETARNWYRQAAQLGATEADERIRRLGGP